MGSVLGVERSAEGVMCPQLVYAIGIIAEVSV